VAPPFGGFFFQYFGHSVPFILLALMCLCDAFLIGMIAAKKAEDDVARENKPVGTPMWKLMSDPYIAIIAGALVGKDKELCKKTPSEVFFKLILYLKR